MLSRKLVSIVVMLGLIGSASAALNYEYYEAPEGMQYNALADVNFGEAEPNMIGTSDTLDSGDGNWIEQAGGHRGEDFAFRFFGHIVVPISGEITFYTRSDDGSRLFIDDQVVVENDGLHGASAFPGVAGTIALDAGVHTIDVIMFERGGGDNVYVNWSAGGQTALHVPDSVLFLEAPADISGIPASVIVSLKATNPTPADGTVEALDADVALLSWNSGYGAVSYDLYISADAEIDAADLAATVTDPNYAVTEPVVPGITYFWRVDATDADTTYEGDVWQITAMSDQAHYPMPADADLWSLGIDTELSWTAGTGAMVHNVYFSADQALVDARDPSVATMFWMLNTLEPAELAVSTTYYWAVDEFSAAGTVAGPTWSFDVFSFDPIAVTDENLMLQYGFDEIQGGLINDLSGHANFGVVGGDSPDIMIAKDGDMGYVLSLPGGTNQFVAAMSPTGIDGNDVRTISCWAKADSTSIPDWTLIFGFTGQEDASGGTGSHFNIGSLGGPGGIGAHAWGWEETMIDDANGLDWHHYAMTYDGIEIAYFLDGMAMDSDPNKSNVINLVNADRVHVGSRITGDSSFPGSVDDCRVYNRVLSEEEIVWAMNMLADITGPNDMVQGVPNEVRDGDAAGWPDGEAPNFAIDNSSGTKFLHFAGEVVPTGIQVAPAAGITVVTGLTLTTANDTPERDPITYELSGSNEGIDGPYELIASGDIVDFNQVDAYPRFTKNATTIVIDNEVAYGYYQVLFPTVRDAANTNSMQIAEIELIGEVIRDPLVAWVSFHEAGDLPSGGAAGADFTEAPDKAYTDLLIANGYEVVRIITSKTPDVDLLNTMDLVITSRSVSSSHYSGSGASLWNSVTAPMIITGGYTTRSSRMGFTTGKTMVDTTGDINLAVNDADHPIFAGIDLVDGVMANPFAGIVIYPTDGTTVAKGVSINNNEMNADGTLLATVANEEDPTVGGMVIAEWQAGATLTHDGGDGTDILAGHRLVFLTGARENGYSSETAGLYDLYTDGELMLLNAIEYMLLQ